MVTNSGIAIATTKLIIQQMKNVRILLVGDDGVGKTSLILALISEEFPLEVPDKAEDITISANVTPEQVPTHIVDYSSKQQTDKTLNEEILKANVICIVYAVNDEESLERVTTYWLPRIRETLGDDQPLKPIVLAGNKIDIVDYSTVNSVYGIMQKYPEVESCVECSAKTLHNLAEMFYYAQKAVLHPTSPVYSVDEQDLTPACKKSLLRIFKICDLDGDNLLNDHELNVFQKYCFNTPLQPQALDEVKAIIEKNIFDGVYNDAITLRGFLFLHLLFIQKGRTETTWTVLRQFGYNDQLDICKEYLKPLLKVPCGSTTELSQRGQQFLIALFERYDIDGDGALSLDEYKTLFSICPTAPWSYSTDICKLCPTNENGWITLQTWLCRWTLMTFLDVQKTLEYLGYLGFSYHENDTQLAAIHVTRECRMDAMKRHHNRSVYVCHVIGSTNCGKNSLCRAFLTNDMPSLIGKEFPMNIMHCINTVPVYDQEKYLILRDIDVKHSLDPLQTDEIICDVACLVYDTSNALSFEHIARLYVKYFAESKIPVMIVGIINVDMPKKCQNYSLQPEEFCRKYKLMPPQMFSLNDNNRELYMKLATMAAFPRFPDAWILFSKHRRLRQFGLIGEDRRIWWKASLGVAIATVIGFVVLRAIQTINTTATHN